MTKGPEKMEVRSATFPSAFPGEVCPRATKAPEPGGRSCWGEALPAVSGTKASWTYGYPWDQVGRI